MLWERGKPEESCVDDAAVEDAESCPSPLSDHVDPDQV